MAKFQVTELIDDSSDETWRLGTGTGAANQYKDSEIGKAVKLVGESRYALCSAGDPIEGFVRSVEVATMDNYGIGTVMKGRRKRVLADGLQATPGTGTLAIGDYVVAGTMVAKDTALTLNAPQKVCKATVQPGTTEVAADTDVNEHLKVLAHPWRVVSLGSAGTGAVGTEIIIERVNRA